MLQNVENVVGNLDASHIDLIDKIGLIQFTASNNEKKSCEYPHHGGATVFVLQDTKDIAPMNEDVQVRVVAQAKSLGTTRYFHVILEN